MPENNRALIDKETLSYICSSTRVTAAYLAGKIGLAESIVARFLTVDDELLPTMDQAKAIAKALRLPFVALYLNIKNIKDKIKPLPYLQDFRTIPAETILDDSALNIVISNLYHSRDFILSTERELGLENTQVMLPEISQYNKPIDIALTIREFFDLKYSFKDKINTQEDYYFNLRNKIENKGILISCFTDVEVEMASGLAIWDDGLPIIGINANGSYLDKLFSIIHELIHILKRQSAICNKSLLSTSLNQEKDDYNSVVNLLFIPINKLYQELTSKKSTIISEAVDNNGFAFCKVLYLGYCEDLFSIQDLSGLLGLGEEHIPAFIAEVGKW
jgi:transcriptional regulator with XRE-family HTH domain